MLIDKYFVTDDHKFPRSMNTSKLFLFCVFDLFMSHHKLN